MTFSDRPLILTDFKDAELTVRPGQYEHVRVDGHSRGEPETRTTIDLDRKQAIEAALHMIYLALGENAARAAEEALRAFATE